MNHPIPEKPAEHEGPNHASFYLPPGEGFFYSRCIFLDSLLQTISYGMPFILGRLLSPPDPVKLENPVLPMPDLLVTRNRPQFLLVLMVRIFTSWKKIDPWFRAFHGLVIQTALEAISSENHFWFTSGIIKSGAGEKCFLWLTCEVILGSKCIGSIRALGWVQEGLACGWDCPQDCVQLGFSGQNLGVEMKQLSDPEGPPDQQQNKDHSSHFPSDGKRVRSKDQSCS